MKGVRAPKPTEECPDNLILQWEWVEFWKDGNDWRPIPKGSYVPPNMETVWQKHYTAGTVLYLKLCTPFITAVKGEE